MAVLAAALLALAAPRAMAEGATLLEVRDVKVTAPAEGAARVSVTTSAEPRYSARIADGGTRLVVDISDADVNGAPARHHATATRVVAGVMTQAFEHEGKQVTRVIVQLAHAAEYRIATDPTGLAHRPRDRRHDRADARERARRAPAAERPRPSALRRRAPRAGVRP